ncbi:hypothetical protein [Paenibacillus sp. CF384]|uniref:hypothetical protein n=1 Tax=Paenibacillus sp. CF384 TaxID=1884382 RepID=UPI00089B3279|nr:hypothetical protein [Paenibacillus sp. CF384]SDW96493.1 hypothetical protein SAMN05518855_100790 [Paenibacillus sp. CF384]
MPFLSTGPVANHAVGAIDRVQQLVVRMVNRDLINMSTVLVEGFYLNGDRTMYVYELVSLLPNQTFMKVNYADFDAYEYQFTIGGDGANQTEISAWGKTGTGRLVDAQRLIAVES